MSTMGQRIKESRERLGMYQSQLAQAIGVKSAAVISNWEKDINKPDAEKIVSICKALKISLSYLLNYYGNDKTFETTQEEQSHIKKYRFLNETGKKKVDDYLDDLINAGTYTDAQQHVDIEMPAPKPEPTLDELIARLDVGQVVAFGGGSKQLPPLDPKTKAEIGELLKKLEDKGK